MFHVVWHFTQLFKILLNPIDDMKVEQKIKAQYICVSPSYKNLFVFGKTNNSTTANLLS